MMRKYVFILLLGVSLSAVAQSAQQADALFTAKDYAKAQTAYGNLLRKSPKNQLYLYRIARCAYELGDTQTAIRRFEEAGEKYALRNYYLGELYFGEYRFAEAFAAYERYLESIEPGNDRYHYVEEQMVKAEKGERYMRRVEDVSIISHTVVAKKDFLGAYELSPEAGTLTETDGRVTYTNQRGDRKVMACDTAGRKDLYFSQWLINSWGDSVALPAPVNTMAEENYPFLLTDGITLYFGSDRGDGLGGYDIYLTRYNSTTDNYLQPENIGMPFNSFANDYMLAIDENKGIGYFATDRNTATDSVSVYCFVPNEEKTILHNFTDEKARLTAQLKMYRKAQKVMDVSTENENKVIAEDETGEFIFIVNDSTVYSDWQDFRSKEAKTLYRSYRQAARQAEQNKENLLRLRQEYMTTSPEKQVVISEKILTMEEEIPLQKQWLQSTLNEIRRLENEALQNFPILEK
ncbi:MAG: tetratricopeptide repeat protein [Paludibacteraceae bacterium]